MPDATLIDQTFISAREDGRLAFMPFVTAGDPDLPATIDVIRRMAEEGVDLIEVGFPYSDPIADGPVIQASYTRALAAGFHVADLFAAVRELKQEKKVAVPPLLAMVSYAIIYRHGVEAFIQEASDAGFAGFIIPDLPGDEAADCFAAVRREALDLVQLIAPTTPPERIHQVLKHCSGFVYCLAVAGITGEREQVATTLHEHLRELRPLTELPLAVGFGISKPDHLTSLKPIADGAIVGTAVVRHLEAVSNGDLSREAAIEQIGQLSAAMNAAR